MLNTFHDRVVLRRTRLSGLVAIALVASYPSGCGSSTPTLNTAAIKRAVAASILAQHHLHATVNCPTDVPRKAGFAFTCTARLNAGTYPILVTETNSSGHVRYENRTPLIALDTAGVQRAISRSIRSQRHLASSVTCPANVIQRIGIAFTCTAMVNGQSYPFAVTEVNDKGRVRYIGLRRSSGSPLSTGEGGG